MDPRTAKIYSDKRLLVRTDLKIDQLDLLVTPQLIQILPRVQVSQELWEEWTSHQKKDVAPRKLLPLNNNLLEKTSRDTLASL